MPHPPSNDAREIQPSLAPWKQSLKPLSSNGPQAAYWLAHHFDQPANTINNAQPTIDEKIRFLLWNNAGKKDIFKLSGYFEHQYGHRISLQSEVPLDFKRSVDIVNPASIFFGEQAKIANNNKNSLFPLLQVKENPDDTLDIYFSTLAIRYAYQYYFTHPSNESTGTDSFSDLRTLYRALMELRDAITNKSAFLVIEGWTFDNKKVLGFGKGVTLADGLTMIEENRISIPCPDEDLGSFFASLNDSLEVFLDKVATISNNTEDKIHLIKANISSLASKASLLRVGIMINRDDSLKPSYPDWQYATWAFLSDSAFDNNDQTSELIPHAQRVQLITNAKNELNKYLSSQPEDSQSFLHHSLSWIINPEMEKHAPLLGPGASSLLVPNKPTEVALPSIKNMEAYYLPYAFMLPQAHPALGDRQSSFDFACFLLLLIEDISEGRSISDRVVINLSTKYNLFRDEILSLLPLIAENLIKLFNLFLLMNHLTMDPCGLMIGVNGRIKMVHLIEKILKKQSNHSLSRNHLSTKT